MLPSSKQQQRVKERHRRRVVASIEMGFTNTGIQFVSRHIRYFEEQKNPRGKMEDKLEGHFIKVLLNF